MAAAALPDEIMDTSLILYRLALIKTSHAMRALCVPVGLVLSSFSHTLVKPGTSIRNVFDAGKRGS